MYHQEPSLINSSMQFFSFFGLVALATLALATSHANFRDIISDLNSLRDKAMSLGNHVRDLDLVVRHLEHLWHG